MNLISFWIMARRCEAIYENDIDIQIKAESRQAAIKEMLDEAK